MAVHRTRLVTIVHGYPFGKKQQEKCEDDAPTVTVTIMLLWADTCGLPKAECIWHPSVPRAITLK
eukprot:scaffold32677_cov130-Amphora_coffeaeformis.AAC.1